jgi:uncharacterized membrane protein
MSQSVARLFSSKAPVKGDVAMRLLHPHPHRHRPIAEVPKDKPEMLDVIGRNITTMVELRREEKQNETIQDKAADGLTAFSGSMIFVYIHLLWFGLWIIINLGWSGIKPFDPFPFGLLTLMVSLEAIFLSTFVLISQNRAGEVADKRADLDLQIDLLAEHKITHLITMVAAIADHLGIDTAKMPELAQLESDVAPKEVLDEIRDRQRAEKKNE